MPIAARHATGKNAKAQCPTCGFVVNYADLKKDYRGTWVCPTCLDPRPAQEMPARKVVDAVALRHAQPLRDAGLTVAQPYKMTVITKVGSVDIEVI